MPFIGHAATRARGTIGGSLANADPAAEIALVAVTLGATLVLSRRRHRHATIAARDFFLGPMTTALPPAPCLDRGAFSGLAGQRVGIGFHEVNARRSDFAFVAAAAQVELDARRHDARASRIGVGAATDVPMRLDGAERGVDRQRASTRERCETRCARRSPDIEPMADLHASAEYRRRVAATLGRPRASPTRAMTRRREARP